MAPLVSVIIPAYNAAGTLQSAVESVLGQPVRDLEVLIVDDGSTDGTAEVCAALAQRDARVRVFRQENRGISAARNCGLRFAAGQWLTFCDDDDRMEQGALPLLLQAVNDAGVDVVRGGYTLLRTKADGTEAEVEHPAGVPCRADAGGGFSILLDNCGPQFVWNALYRKTVTQGILFDENCRYGVEDFIFNYEVYAVARTVLYLPQSVYCHYERGDSTSALVTQAALAGRTAALTPWMAAAYRAAESRCRQSRAAVWAGCRADAVTFLMHQLHDAAATPAQRRQAFGILRSVLGRYPHSLFDFLRITRYRQKSAFALLLYELHLQGLYELMPHKEDLA